MNLTDDEYTKLTSTNNEREWNATCDEIKAAREGEYPPDWFIRILASGVTARMSAKWKANAK